MLVLTIAVMIFLLGAPITVVSRGVTLGSNSVRSEDDALQTIFPAIALATRALHPKSRTRFYEILSLVLSDESYKRILVQQLSNLMLGEMQQWAVNCEGHCE